MKRSLASSDDRLAKSVAETERPHKESGRKYRCSTCGVMYPAEELTPENDENGRRVGWACESCY